MLADAATAHAGASVLETILSCWWLFLIFGGAILEWVADTFDTGLRALRRRSKGKRKHQVELKRLELEIAQARSGAALPATVKPGPCVHRNVVPVVSKAEDVVAWLCRSCDERLPANWAVREEDL